jgi:hypothetical protein
MLSREDNELLCRIGPGTPMGDFMRQYWIPALTSSELSGPDCAPLRVRLLGEDLIEEVEIRRLGARSLREDSVEPLRECTKAELEQPLFDASFHQLAHAAPPTHSA